MWGMEEELTKAKEYAANMANMGQQTSIDTEPRKQKATPEPELELAMDTTSKTGTESTQELRTLREELAAQEALRGKEREQKKLVEEERRRVEENL